MDKSIKGKEGKIKKVFKNRNFWLIMAVLLYGFYSGFFLDLFGYPAGREISSGMARIEIDFGDARRVFEGDVLPDMSILDALLAAAQAGGFEIRYAILDDHTDIIKINDYSEDGLNARNWRFELNGEKIGAAEIHKVKIRSGDKISARFE